MPIATPEQTSELSPEQRLAQLFEEKGETVMDGSPDREVRKETADTEVDEGSAEPDLPESSQEASAESEQEQETEEGEDESAAGDEGEASQLEGIEAATLAEVLGVEENVLQVDEQGQPTFSVTIEGETESVSLPRLLKGFQQEGAFTRKSQELAQARQTFEQQKQQELQTLTLRAQAVDKVLEEHQQDVLVQYEKEDWDTLRRDRPDEFAARRTEYAELYQKLEQRRQAAQQAVVDLHQQEQQRWQATRQQVAQEEGRRLREAVKEWDTDEKASQGAKAVHDFLLQVYGFSEQDLADTLNHRAYLVALDAMKWRFQSKQAEPTRKRVVKAPRVLKPGTPSTEGDRQRAQAVKIANRHRKEKSVDSAADAFLAKNIV